MHLIASVPATLAAHPLVAALAIFAFACGCRGLWLLLNPRPALIAPVDDDEDVQRGLRIADDDRHRSAWTYAPAWAIQADYPPPVMRTSAERAAGAAPVEVGTDWVDPMRADYTAAGIGSVTSVTVIEEDTKLRGPLALAALRAAEEEAYAEIPAREEDAFFAPMRYVLGTALANFRTATARAEMWLHYEHGEYDECSKCTAAVAEVSGEYREIVARVLATDTQRFALVR